MTADRRRIPMKPINEMKVTFPSRSANEGFARAVVASFLSQLDPAVDELSDLRTAVSEAVTNCIVHAYPDSIGDITVQMRLFENGRTVVKVDVYKRQPIRCGSRNTMWSVPPTSAPGPPGPDGSTTRPPACPASTATWTGTSLRTASSCPKRRPRRPTRPLPQRDALPSFGFPPH